jgi:hypothetical protein
VSAAQGVADLIRAGKTGAAKNQDAQRLQGFFCK